MLAFGFSGYLLPWNTLAFFATRVGTEIAGQVPLVGQPLLHLMRGGEDVTGAGEQLGDEVMFHALEAWLLETDHCQGDHDRDKAGGVENGDSSATTGCVDQSAHERSDEPKAFPQGLQHSVRLGQELPRDHDRHQCRASGSAKRSRRTIEDGDCVDDPDVAPIVDEEKRQDDDRFSCIDPDQQWAPRQPVDQQAGEGCEQRWHPKSEEHEACGGVTSGQILGPDTEHDEHGPIPEDREGPARDEDADVAEAQQPAHQTRGGTAVARSMRTSPETVFAKTSTSGVSGSASSVGASPSSNSELVSPLTVFAST